MKKKNKEKKKRESPKEGALTEGDLGKRRKCNYGEKYKRPRGNGREGVEYSKTEREQKRLLKGVKKLPSKQLNREKEGEKYSPVKPF